MTNAITHTNIAELRDIFIGHGLREILVSDNGAQFTSTDFEQFCSNTGILHQTSAAYKPSTNGQTERVVQILKSVVKQAQLTNVQRCVSCNCQVIQRQFVPNDLTSLVGQPVEIVSDSFIQSIPVPATAASYKPHLMDSYKRCLPEDSVKSSS